MLLLLAATACVGARPREPVSTTVGKRLAFAAPDLDGHEVDVSAAQGKVRVVDFWATWCDPCKEAMPALDRLAGELGPKGVDVFGVSVDEDRSQIAQFLRERPVRFPILWDKGAERLSRLDARYMPVTLIVDRQGVIRYVHQGWDEARARRQREEIEALVAEP